MDLSSLHLQSYPETKVEIRWINEKKGHGIVAKSGIPKDTVIIEEDPIISCQFPFNAHYFPACGFCMKSLEQRERMLQRLSGRSDTIQLPAHGFKEDIRQPVYCDVCDEENQYCDEVCKQRAWRDFHRFTCTGGRDEHPIYALIEYWKSIHPPPESASIMLIVRILANISARLDDGIPYEDAIAPFMHFKFDERSCEMGMLHRLFEDDFESKLMTLHGLLKQVFQGCRIEELLTYDMFRKWMGIMALNAQGIGTSMLESYQRHLMETDNEESNKILDFIDEFEDDIEEESGPFTCAEGAGLYWFHSKLNHSCVPSAVIRFPYNNHRIQVIAKRDIEAGEEICIDYLFSNDCCESEDDQSMDMNGQCSDDECMSNEETLAEEEDRVSMLKKYYLFDCDCPKCSTQLDVIPLR